MKRTRDSDAVEKPEREVPGLSQEGVSGLLYEALETERCGVIIYDIALRCALNEELIAEWQKYREETAKHAVVLAEILTALGLNPEAETSGRMVIRSAAEGLTRTMEVALMTCRPTVAQVVAAECVVQVETKNHLNWSLIGIVTSLVGGSGKDVFQGAIKDIEQQQGAHLYHSTGWARELHIAALGLRAELPPAEEKRDGVSASSAAAVLKERKDGLTMNKPRQKRRAAAL